MSLSCANVVHIDLLAVTLTNSSNKTIVDVSRDKSIDATQRQCKGLMLNSTKLRARKKLIEQFDKKQCLLPNQE